MAPLWAILSRIVAKGVGVHFFYIDESGCTGANLADAEQPIFVLGGISVKAQGWRLTTEEIIDATAEFFGGKPPAGFELHAADLINGARFFASYKRDVRNALVHRLLNIIIERGHAVHFVGIDKAKLAAELPGDGHAVFHCGVPYLLAFNYLVSYIERYTKEKLGQTVRGMIILDTKDPHHGDIDAITHYRRFEVPKVRRLKWLVEFSYPVDSIRHPMIQVSDLVVFLIRKFLEVENGYRDGWPADAKSFFALCYAKLIERVQWVTLIDVPGDEEAGAHALLSASRSTHRPQWKQRYVI